jgi:hypothetical protein
MFCAGCGTQIQSGLNYCSRCGRRVADDTKLGKTRSPLMIAGNTAGVGFVGFIFVLAILAKYGVAPDVFIPVTFFYFAALFGLCFMFLRQGANISRTESSPAAEEVKEPTYLSPVTTAQLREGFDTPASVTDHTTRTLDEVPIRKA